MHWKFDPLILNVCWPLFKATGPRRCLREQVNTIEKKVGKTLGFTLMELLVVIVIIILIAGLILGTAAYVQNKQVQVKTESQLHQIELCLELYKNDQGYYPISPYDWPRAYSISHAFDAGVDYSIWGVDPTTTSSNHWAFYRALFGYTSTGGVYITSITTNVVLVTNGPPPIYTTTYSTNCAPTCTNGFPQPSIGRNYYPEVKPGQITSNRQMTSSAVPVCYYWFLTDPFGKPWGYFNAPDASSRASQFNPRTYDLWSFGKYPQDPTNSLISNWRQR